MEDDGTTSEANCGQESTQLFFVKKIFELTISQVDYISWYYFNRKPFLDTYIIANGCLAQGGVK